MCKNKYSSYLVKTEYLNGDTEVIDYNEKDSRSYKQILDLYKETKKAYADESTCVKVNFCGITEDKNINILFTKEITNEEDLKIKENADAVKETSVSDITNNMIKLLDMMLEKHDKLNENLNVLNKKQDVELHKIEMIKHPTDAYKMELYNNIASIRKDRRTTKNELTLLGVCNIKDIKNQILRTKKAENTMIKTENKIINNGLEDYVFVKEIKYRSSKELAKLMIELNEKYDKVYEDQSDMSISCYNNNGCKYNHKATKVKTTPVIVKNTDTYKVMRVVRFSTFPEKIKSMSRLSKSYDLVKANDEKMEITCSRKL